ncbi:MAG: SDR family NAD(P)-dependent oxidoreductase [Candidatus Hodarchaeota archaeon]
MSKRILITGASSGLGLSHAIYLTSQGNSIVGTSRNPEKLSNKQLKNRFLIDHTKFKYIDKAKTKIQAGNVRAPKKLIDQLDDILEEIQFISMDISDTKSVNNAINNLESSETIDILINNAGNGFFGPVEELSFDNAQYQFEVNFFGLIRILQAIIPIMRSRQSGQIINTSSLAGVICIPFQGHYSASKAAILRLTESLRRELKPFNIRVSSLLPGDINTPFDANTIKLHYKEKDITSEDIEEMINLIPLSEESPYFNEAKKAWRTIIQNLIVSPPPIIVSKKIEKIIKAKQPKVHYKVGSRLQTYGTILMKRVLSENLTMRVTEMFYGL